MKLATNFKDHFHQKSKNIIEEESSPAEIVQCAHMYNMILSNGPS